MAENKKSTSNYALKQKQGVERNHVRHPKKGVAWCSLCQGEGRKFIPKEILTISQLVKHNWDNRNE